MANYTRNYLDIKGDPKHLREVFQLVNNRTNPANDSRIARKAMYIELYLNKHNLNSVPKGGAVVPGQEDFVKSSEVSVVNSHVFDDYHCYFHLSSAWSPEVQMVCILSYYYPELYFRLEYQSEGSDFGGLLKFRGGKTIYHWEGLYKEYKYKTDYEDFSKDKISYGHLIAKDLNYNLFDLFQQEDYLLMNFQDKLKLFKSVRSEIHGKNLVECGVAGTIDEIEKNG